MLREELQQLELLEGEVEDATAELRGVRALVHHELAAADLLGFRRRRIAHLPDARDGEAQAGLELGR